MLPSWVVPPSSDVCSSRPDARASPVACLGREFPRDAPGGKDEEGGTAHRSASGDYSNAGHQAVDAFFPTRGPALYAVAALIVLLCGTRGAPAPSVAGNPARRGLCHARRSEDEGAFMRQGRARHRGGRRRQHPRAGRPPSRTPARYRAHQFPIAHLQDSRDGDDAAGGAGKVTSARPCTYHPTPREGRSGERRTVAPAHAPRWRTGLRSGSGGRRRSTTSSRPSPT